MISGVCKLCQEKKMLCLSHFVPARLYKYCRAGEVAPIRFTSKEIGQTEEELAAYLLCSKCEKLLNLSVEFWAGQTRNFDPLFSSVFLGKTGPTVFGQGPSDAFRRFLA